VLALSPFSIESKYRSTRFYLIQKDDELQEKTRHRVHSIVVSGEKVGPVFITKINKDYLIFKQGLCKLDGRRFYTFRSYALRGSVGVWCIPEFLDGKQSLYL
jgi:hypothetical protein